MRSPFALFGVPFIALLAATSLGAAEGPNPAELTAAQQRAMVPLRIFDGVWRGPSTIVSPDGQRHEHTQTERVGSMLNGSIKVIEGRGYAPDGNITFNALGVISFSPQGGTYSLHSYAQGHAGDFPMTVTADGFSWSMKFGATTIRYTATVAGDIWTEIGDLITDGQPAVRTFEMALRRIGGTGWPEAGAVPRQ